MKGKSGGGRNDYLLQNLEAQKLFPKRILKKIQVQIPSHLENVKINTKNDGLRWQIKHGKDYIRIDKGNQTLRFQHQKVDHVRINKNGQVIGRNGNAITSSSEHPRPKNAPDAHIPLKEWLNWKSWDNP